MSALAAVLLSATVALAPVADPYDWTLIGKAQADECFAGVGVPYPPGPPCASGQPKVNQAYVWGLTKAGKQNAEAVPMPPPHSATSAER